MGCAQSYEAHHKDAAEAIIKIERQIIDLRTRLCTPDEMQQTRIQNRLDHVSEFDRVVVSFPGAHGFAWNYLDKHCHGMDHVKTTCVFLPDKKSPNWGQHCVMNKDGRCACHYLYDGKKEAFGCKWFGAWQARTNRAVSKGARLFVVTKADGKLGRSQRSEVRFLEKKEIDYHEIPIQDFVGMVTKNIVDPPCAYQATEPLRPFLKVRV